MPTPLERARSEVQKLNQEQWIKDKARQLFDIFVTWYEAQPAETLELIIDFPQYKNFRGVRRQEGPANPKGAGERTRWTIGKEQASEEKPNLPVVVLFEYWGEKSVVGSDPPQYTESYLLYKDLIQRGELTSALTSEDRGELNVLTNLINTVIQTHPTVTTAQRKE